MFINCLKVYCPHQNESANMKHPWMYWCTDYVFPVYQLLQVCILFKKRNAKPHNYWWHWEDNFNCCMVGPQGLHFCKSDFGHLWPTAQNLDILGPTIQQLKLSSQCHQYVVLRFFFWMWFCVSFFEMVLRFFFWRVYFNLLSRGTAFSIPNLTICQSHVPGEPIEVLSIQPSRLRSCSASVGRLSM